MKKTELIFNVISVPIDFLMIVLAATIAYFLRYEVETLPVQFELSFTAYFKLILVAIPFLVLLFALSGLYSQRSTRSLTHEIGKVATAVSVGLMIVVFLFFFDRNLFPSRLIILMNWVFIILLISFSRSILLYAQRRMLSRGVGRHKLLVVVGENHTAIIDEIEKNASFGYEIVAREPYADSLLEKLEHMHRCNGLDEVLQADVNLSNPNVLKLVNVCEELGIKFNYLPNVLESHRANLEIDVIGSMPVIRLRGTPLDGWGTVVKRIIDIIASAIGLILTSPIFLILTILIKLDSKGPVFFHQRRGSSFHNFEFYKFRTMRSDLSEGTPEGDRIRAELERLNVRHGPYVKIKNDPRVTGVGKWLRKTKLDELPQLWHIMRGQMSLVGPRIHMTKEVEKFESSHRKIFTNVKPGATGISQINQIMNPELPFEEEIKLDLFYIENWSVWLDFYIIFKTVVMLLWPPKGDY